MAKLLFLIGIAILIIAFFSYYISSKSKGTKRKRRNLKDTAIPNKPTSKSYYLEDTDDNWGDSIETIAESLDESLDDWD